MARSVARWCFAPPRGGRAGTTVAPPEQLEPRTLLSAPPGFVDVVRLDEFVGPAIDESLRHKNSTKPAQHAPDVKVLDVPVYLWWYGCTPTAVGMVAGYWDTHGYPRVFANTNGSTMTQVVRDEVAGPAHRIAGQENRPVIYGGKFWGHGDWKNSPSFPAHEANPASLADHLKTRDGLSLSADQLQGMRSWFSTRGTGWVVKRAWYRPDLWDRVVAALDAGKPLVAGVDNNADGKLDHSATIIGYNRRTKQLAYYDTWHRDVKWYDFAPVGAGTKFGVRNVYLVDPPPKKAPAPAKPPGSGK